MTPYVQGDGFLAESAAPLDGAAQQHQYLDPPRLDRTGSVPVAAALAASSPVVSALLHHQQVV